MRLAACQSISVARLWFVALEGNVSPLSPREHYITSYTCCLSRDSIIHLEGISLSHETRVSGEGRKGRRKSAVFIIKTFLRLVFGVGRCTSDRVLASTLAPRLSILLRYEYNYIYERCYASSVTKTMSDAVSCETGVVRVLRNVVCREHDLHRQIRGRSRRDAR